MAAGRRWVVRERHSVENGEGVEVIMQKQVIETMWEPPGTLRTQLDPLRARAIANQFILENLADRFSAGEPRLLVFPVRVVWIVPVELTYPSIGVVGQVGFVAVDGEQETVVGWTPFEVMEATAQALYTSHRDAIEAAFS